MIGNFCRGSALGSIIPCHSRAGGAQNVQNGVVADAQGSSIKDDCPAGEGRRQGCFQAAPERVSACIQTQLIENGRQIFFCVKAGEGDGPGSCHGIALAVFISVQIMVITILYLNGIIEGDGGSVIRAGGKFKRRRAGNAVEHGSGEVPFLVILLHVVGSEFNGIIIGDGEAWGIDSPSVGSGAVSREGDC